MKNILGAITVSVLFLATVVSAQSLKIDNFSIKLNGETEVISVKKDGKVTLNGKQGGVLQADGKLIDLQGKTVAEIDKTGKVSVNDKPVVMINKKGELDNGSGKIISWTKDGKFGLSESQFLTVSPNKKKFYQPASFLIFLYLYGTKVETQLPKVSLNNKTFNYKDTDLVASVNATAMRGGYSIKVFGNGTISVEGESFETKKNAPDKEKVKGKIALFLQRAEGIDFAATFKKSMKATTKFVYDGFSNSTGVWQNGVFRQAGCSSGNDYCPQEIKELHSYFFALFTDDIKRRKLN
jgi:hypothetical protein